MAYKPRSKTSYSTAGHSTRNFFRGKGKRRTRRSRRTNAGKKALGMVKNLQRQLNKNTVIKYKDFSHAATLATGVESIHHLTGILQGDVTNVNSREGPCIKMRGVSYRMRCYLGDLEDSPQATFRFIIIQDRRCNGAATGAAMNVIFNDNTTVALIRNDDPSERGRYQILHDQTFNLGVGNNGIVFEKGFLDLSRTIKVDYKSTGNAIADVERGALFCYVITEGNNVSMFWQGEFKLQYVDVQ